MPYDGLVTAAIRKELEQKLLNSRVDRVHQPNRDEIVLAMRQPGESFLLLLSASPRYARCHIATGFGENPQDAPPFCMLLRKQLRGARLLGIEQPDFDRILRLNFETYDDYAQVAAGALVIEIMGRHSNIILLGGDNGNILDSARHVTDEVSRVREVLPGAPYMEPPNQNRQDPRNVRQEFFENLMLTATDLGLASCWVAAPIFCPEEARDALALPAEWLQHALVLVGRPDPAYVGRARPHVPLDEIRRFA
jgi:predicted ribosome quality control (RQC) complex YloA/Tae2 family protein